jgi:hypothetical protein
MTKVEIECLSDMDMVLFLEQGIRGGVSFINLRYCEGMATSGNRAESNEEDNIGVPKSRKPTLLYIDGNYI